MPQSVRLPPLSIRLSEKERAALTRRAGSMGLSTYAKSVLFSEEPFKGRRGRASADRVLLAQLLGQLGASGLASSLRRLAAAADSGSLHIDDLTIRHLHDACDDVRGIHLHLMKALGKKVPNGAPKPERMSIQFIRVASDTSQR